MKLAEYALESVALLGRIKNTATMINSYIAKFHSSGLLLMQSSPLANTAIDFVNVCPIPASISLMNIMPQDLIDESKFQLTIESLERKLSALNRISYQYQELHALFVAQGKLK